MAGLRLFGSAARGYSLVLGTMFLLVALFRLAVYMGWVSR